MTIEDDNVVSDDSEFRSDQPELSIVLQTGSITWSELSQSTTIIRE